MAVTYTMLTPKWSKVNQKKKKAAEKGHLRSQEELEKKL